VDDIVTSLRLIRFASAVAWARIHDQYGGRRQHCPAALAGRLRVQRLRGSDLETRVTSFT